MEEKCYNLFSGISLQDERIFRDFYDYYRSRIYTVALRLSNDVATAEDVVQDTFLKIWIIRDEIKHIDNIEKYVFVIAKNSVLNLIKKNEHYKRYAQEVAKDAILRVFSDTDFNVQEKEFEDILQQAIKRLPEKQRQAYILSKEKYLTRNEAAKELNVSPETIKSNLEKAIKSIRAFCLRHLKELPIIFILYFFSKYF